MNFYNGSEIKEKNEESDIKILFNNKKLNIEIIKNDDYFYETGYIINPLNKYTKVLKLEKVDNDIMDKILKLLCKKEKCNLNELNIELGLELGDWSPEVYCLKYRGLLKIEDKNISLLKVGD